MISPSATPLLSVIADGVAAVVTIVREELLGRITRLEERVGHLEEPPPSNSEPPQAA